MREERGKIFIIISGIIFLILIFRIFYLQNGGDKSLFERALNNKIEDIIITPSRGNIYDRNGNLLVDNKHSYNLYIVPKWFEKDSLSAKILASILEINPDSLLKDVSRMKKKDREYSYRRNIGINTYLKYSEQEKSLRGVRVKNEWKRDFPLEIAPHLIGHLVEAKDKKILKKGQKLGDLVGIDGVEYVYDDILRGKKGLEQEIRDVKSKKVSDYKKENWISAVKGEDIYLTIDYRLQMFTEKLLDGKSGSIIVMDCNNGEILAMASKPDFSLSIYSERISNETWNKLINDPGRPLYSKAVQGEYSPGSLLKMINYLSAAEQEIVDRSTKFNCPGGMKIGNSYKKCWYHKGHGEINGISAIQVSCDVYFYEVAKNIDIDRWNRYLKKFGIGEKTGVDLRYERDGNIPDYKFYRSRFRGSLLGRFANLLIGQGEILVTPLQTAVFISSIANGGFRVKPRVVQKYGSDNNFSYTKKKATPIEINREDLKSVRKGMFNVVNILGGTAYKHRSEKIIFAGKTGTVENAHGPDHAWFSGYGPYEDPQITVIGFIEHGEHGSAVAPLVKDVFEFWSELKTDSLKN
ncbi:MAG: penicillin-binding protein 2 [Candidatus Delongbacteria bacterium]|nr:MAG: penicillin-binding protein 2 [Candidatus Delongbacteria bacterium]